MVLGDPYIYIPTMMTICAGSFSCSDSESAATAHDVLHHIGASGRFIYTAGWGSKATSDLYN
jgi:hypothetical protein